MIKNDFTIDSYKSYERLEVKLLAMLLYSTTERSLLQKSS